SFPRILSSDELTSCLQELVEPVPDRLHLRPLEQRPGLIEIPAPREHPRSPESPRGHGTLLVPLQPVQSLQITVGGSLVAPSVMDERADGDVVGVEARRLIPTILQKLRGRLDVA